MTIISMDMGFSMLPKEEDQVPCFCRIGGNKKSLGITCDTHTIIWIYPPPSNSHK